MALKLKDSDPVKRMKEIEEELKDPSLGEFSDLDQDPYVIESKRDTPIERPVYQPNEDPYLISNAAQVEELFGNDGQKEKKLKKIRTEMILFTVIGLILLLLGTGQYFDNQRFLKRAKTVDGAVSSSVRSSNLFSRHRHSYLIYVEYTVDGKSYNEFYRRSQFRGSRGEHATVYYDPLDPSRISDGRKIPRYFFLFVVLGGFMGVTGGYILILMSKDPDRAIAQYENLTERLKKDSSLTRYSRWGKF